MFVKKMGLEARMGESAHCAFPFDPEAMDKKRAEGGFLLIPSDPSHTTRLTAPLKPYTDTYNTGDPAAIEGTK